MSVYSTECGHFLGLPLTGTVSGSTATIYASAYCSLNGLTYYLEYTEGMLSENLIEGNYSVYQGASLYDWGTFSVTRSTNIITAQAGTGGSISPSGTVYVTAGLNKTFSISPDTGYRILKVLVDGSSVGAAPTYTFYTVSANHTITAEFRLIQTSSPALPLLLLGD